ncbi:helix-turn-helix domain-containing transcriptional regulator [Photorhabdus luminescens]|uniref:helix-turn-helix domain-containing transcriptional regulator n=1 Tax=Photorhabdus luminescens TaxID=29488 RepID=UPI00159EDEE9|nr:hypothetical protein [Photorhabdus luminescens]
MSRSRSHDEAVIEIIRKDPEFAEIYLHTAFKELDEGGGETRFLLALSHVAKARNDIYTLWISRCIATARERIPGSIDNYVTGVSERSQQRGNLKDNGYKSNTIFSALSYPDNAFSLILLQRQHNIAIGQ